MNDLTSDLTEMSLHSVRSQINKKISNTPFLATGNLVKKSVTDMDHHPYSRWFRGVYYYPDPIIAEREAGWRPLENQCYDVIKPMLPEPEQEYCFEAPCTTTFPCDPSKSTMAKQRDCIVKYY